MYSYDCIQEHVFALLKRAHRERNMYQALNNCQNIFVLLTHIFFILVRINEVGMEVNFIRLKLTIIICEYSIYVGTFSLHLLTHTQLTTIRRKGQKLTQQTSRCDVPISRS
jgi:hypothetical protein